MSPEAKTLVEKLGLVPHPEGGFYRETFRSQKQVTATGYGGPRVASTAIYYLLPGGAFSAFHRVASDEAWHHYDGDPLELFTLTDDGQLARTIVGRNVLEGEAPQHVVSAGLWQAARPLGDRYSLVGCTVAPGFDFRDFEMPSAVDLAERFPAHAEIILRFTKQ